MAYSRFLKLSPREYPQDSDECRRVIMAIRTAMHALECATGEPLIPPLEDYFEDEHAK